MQKRLLVISYYWLPDEGTGSYRISKFVKYLLRKGWKITLLTASMDSENRYELPDGLELIRIGKQKASAGSKKVNPSIFYAKDQNWKARLKVWLRLNVIIPDAKILWYPSALKAAKKLITEGNSFDVLLSTSPPPSTAIIAKAVAKKFNLPWVADFRDPWTEIYYYEDFPQGWLAKRLNKRMEESVLRKAKAVISVNSGFFPEHETWLKHQHIISNGFDAEDFLPSEGEGPGKLGVHGNEDKFTVAYLGSFKMNQLAAGFLDFLQLIPVKSQAKLRFNFIGNVDVLVQEQILAIKPSGLEINFKGLIPHKEAVATMQQSDLLLLLIGKAHRSKLVFSTKLFEYLMSGKPTLAFGHLGGAADQVIQSSKGGYLSAHKESEGALEYLAQCLKLWESGRAMSPADADALKAYDFESLSERLEQILKDVAG